MTLGSPDLGGLRLGLADESQTQIAEELTCAIEATAAELGIETRRVRRPAEESAVDVLLFPGRPFRYERLFAAPKRSYRLCWYGENLPIDRARLRQTLRSVVPRRVTGLAQRAATFAGTNVEQRMTAWRESIALDREMLGNLRELRRARDSNQLDELVVTSPNRQRAAALAGWPARVVRFGYHAALAGPLQAADREREVVLLIFGRTSPWTPLRARQLRRLEAELGNDLPIRVVAAGLYGEQRHELLGRTRIVLHLHRVPRLSSALRYVLATAGGAAFAGEQTEDDWLPDAADYAVQAPLPQLANEVRALASDEERRRQLVEAGQRLLAGEWSMTNSVMHLLDGFVKHSKAGSGA